MDLALAGRRLSRRKVGSRRTTWCQSTLATVEHQPGPDTSRVAPREEDHQSRLRPSSHAAHHATSRSPSYATERKHGRVSVWLALRFRRMGRGAWARPAAAMALLAPLVVAGCGSQSMTTVTVRHRSAATATHRLVGALAGGSRAAGTNDAVLAPGAAASFSRLAARLPGPIELAVEPLGRGSTDVLGADAPANGWSTTKVPLLVALLKARDEAGATGLTAGQSALARGAITESSNEAAISLFSDLERIEGGLVGASRYMQGVLRSSGDRETIVTTGPPPPGAVTTFGQTKWRPSEAVKFFAALGRGCLLPASQSRFVLSLMQSVEPSESWGLGSVGFLHVAFKGGWGPNPSGAYLVRQSGIIDSGSPRAVAVAIVAFPDSGRFEVGVQMLSETAHWLRTELRLMPHQAAGCLQGQ